MKALTLGFLIIHSVAASGYGCLSVWAAFAWTDDTEFRIATSLFFVLNLGYFMSAISAALRLAKGRSPRASLIIVAVLAALAVGTWLFAFTSRTPIIGDLLLLTFIPSFVSWRFP